MASRNSKGEQHRQPVGNSSTDVCAGRFSCRIEVPTGWKFGLLVMLAMSLAAGLLYGHALNAPWYLDDERVIVGQVWETWDGSVYKHLLQPRGVGMFSFYLQNALHGIDPASFRLVNILIHIVNSGLVVLLANRVFRSNRLLPVFTGFLFLAHPMQTQAVTYVVQRMASLSVLWFLLSCLLFVRWRERLQLRFFRNDTLAWIHYGGALLAGATAVLTKETAAVLPGALFLLDRYFLRGTPDKKQGFAQSLLVVTPFAVAPLILYFGRFLNWDEAAAVATRVASFSGEHVSPVQYLVTELSVVWLYIKLLVFPWPQQLIYDYPIAHELFTPISLLAFVGHLGLLATAWLSRGKWPVCSFGILWFYLGLAVESSIIPLDPVFEHRLYLPMVGVSVMLSWGLGTFSQKRLAIMGMVMVLVVLGGLTWKRNSDWNRPLSFYAKNFQRAPEHFGLKLNYAKLLNDNGQYAEAEHLLGALVRDKPDYPSGYVNLAFSYMQRGKFAEIVELIGQAAEKKIYSAKLFLLLGNAQRALGNDEFAINSYREAVDLDSAFSPAILELARIFWQRGDRDEAATWYRNFLQANPESGEACLRLGMLAVQRRDLGEATPLAAKAVRSLPSRGEAWLLFGAIAKQTGDTRSLQQALARLEKIDPRAADRLKNLRRAE